MHWQRLHRVGSCRRPEFECSPAGAAALAADSGQGGVNMQKEPYLKPEVTSEVLEPGALGCSGSPGGGGALPMQEMEPFFGLCCP